MVESFLQHIEKKWFKMFYQIQLCLIFDRDWLNFNELSNGVTKFLTLAEIASLIKASGCCESFSFLPQF